MKMDKGKVSATRRKREMRKALEAVGIRLLEREDEGWHWRDTVTGYRGTLKGIAELWLAEAEGEMPAPKDGQ